MKGCRRQVLCSGIRVDAFDIDRIDKYSGHLSMVIYNKQRASNHIVFNNSNPLPRLS
jgi:hypothetical protein